jgi:tetratricopeptide (TPR) repeat protein
VPRERDEPPTLQVVAPSYDPIHLPDEVVKELRSTARPGKGEILVKVFADAAAAFAADDMDEALRLAEQAKHIALRAATARELLGLVYHRMGRWKEAARELAAFRRISGSTSQNPVLADAYRAMGRPDRALELCDEIDPIVDDPEVVYEGTIVAAGSLADLDQLDDAIERMMTLRLDPPTAEIHHMRAWYALADLLERKGRFTQAREYFEAVAASDPDLTDAPERAARLSRH